MCKFNQTELIGKSYNMSYEPIAKIEELSNRVASLETDLTSVKEGKVKAEPISESLTDTLTQEQINTDVEERLRRIEELLAL